MAKKLEKQGKKTLTKTEAKDTKTEAKTTKEPKDVNSEPFIVCEATNSTGVKFQKQFRASLIPLACVFVQMLDKSIHILAWTVSKARAQGHVNRVNRLYIDSKSGVFLEKRYLSVEMTDEIKQVKELTAREDRTAFKVAKRARLEKQAKTA